MSVVTVYNQDFIKLLEIVPINVPLCSEHGSSQVPEFVYTVCYSTP